MADVKETARRSAGAAEKQGAETVREGAERVGRFAQAQQEQVAAAAGEIAERGRAGFEGALDASATMAQGMRQAVELWSEYAQESWRRQLETAQELLRCRTFDDVVRVQSEFVRESLERFLERSRRMTQLSADIANDAMHRGAEGQQRMAAE